MEVFVFNADKLMVMGNSKNLPVFNFAILLKSRKFTASVQASHTIYCKQTKFLPIQQLTPSTKFKTLTVIMR